MAKPAAYVLLIMLASVPLRFAGPVVLALFAAIEFFILSHKKERTFVVLDHPSARLYNEKILNSMIIWAAGNGFWPQRGVIFLDKGTKMVVF